MWTVMVCSAAWLDKLSPAHPVTVALKAGGPASAVDSRFWWHELDSATGAGAEQGADECTLPAAASKNGPPRVYLVKVGR